MSLLHPSPHPSVSTRVLATVVVLLALACIAFALRTGASLVLLRSAQALGTPAIAKVRPWMTLDYVAHTYRVPLADLAQGLGLSRDADPQTSLLSLAMARHESPPSTMLQVQGVLAALMPRQAAQAPAASSAGPGSFADEALAALVVNGYPVLALILAFGAIGLPLPAALAAIVAGSLVAAGKLDGVTTAGVALAASWMGDLAGYGIGRLISPERLARRVRWLGVTAARRARGEAMLARWGTLSVLLTRTLVSSLSAVVNLVAGAGRFDGMRFAVLALGGRALWTLAYLGLGITAGADLDAAASFLSNLSLLAIALTLFVATGLALHQRRRAA